MLIDLDQPRAWKLWRAHRGEYLVAPSIHLLTSLS